MSKALDELDTVIEKVRASTLAGRRPAKTLYHGTDASYKPAQMRPSKKGLLGPGYYATSKPGKAGGIYGSKIHRFKAGGKMATAAQYKQRLAERGGVHSVARRSLKAEGISGVRDGHDRVLWNRPDAKTHRAGDYKTDGFKEKLPRRKRAALTRMYRAAREYDEAKASRKRRVKKSGAAMADFKRVTLPLRGEPIEKAKPKTLYVYRPVENAEDLIAWAKSQGFTSTQPADKMHVTLAYSKTPLNWAKLHDDYRLEPDERRASDTCGCAPVAWSEDGQKRRKITGGVREVKAMGKDGAVVLAFESDTLTERWMDFKRAGAVWKFPSFTPHVTLSYGGKGVDLEKVLPYAGDIILGEECWEEVNPEGQAEAIAAETPVTKSDLEALAARLETLEKAQAKPEAA